MSCAQQPLTRDSAVCNSKEAKLATIQPMYFCPYCLGSCWYNDLFSLRVWKSKNAEMIPSDQCFRASKLCKLQETGTNNANLDCKSWARAVRSTNMRSCFPGTCHGFCREALASYVCGDFSSFFIKAWVRTRQHFCRPTVSSNL